MLICGHDVHLVHSRLPSFHPFWAVHLGAGWCGVRRLVGKFRIVSAALAGLWTSGRLAPDRALVLADRSTSFGEISCPDFDRRRDDSPWASSLGRSIAYAAGPEMARACAIVYHRICRLSPRFQCLHQAGLPLRSWFVLSPGDPVDGDISHRPGVGEFDSQSGFQPKRLPGHFVIRQPGCRTELAFGWWEGYCRG